MEEVAATRVASTMTGARAQGEENLDECGGRLRGDHKTFLATCLYLFTTLRRQKKQENS